MDNEKLSVLITGLIMIVASVGLCVFLIHHWLQERAYDKAKKQEKQDKESQPDVIYCDTCGVAVLRDKAHLLVLENKYHEPDKNLYYCQSHAPAYDRIYDGPHFTEYCKEIAVDINGEPIGYVKEQHFNDLAGVTLGCYVNKIKAKRGDKGKGKGMEKGKKGGKCK